MVRPARIELATLGLGVPCSIQFELRARTRSCYILQPFGSLSSLDYSRRSGPLHIRCTGSGVASSLKGSRPSALTSLDHATMRSTQRFRRASDGALGRR